jgi:glycosyltransferase involved in cell wall biosynthesis
MPPNLHIHQLRRASWPRIGLLSTFPPQLCGLATFAAALAGELARSGVLVDHVAVNDGEGTTARSAARMLMDLRHCDVAIVQHEYGIYGGRDGDDVLEVLRGLHVPSIVILHTVPLHPTPHQQFVLEAVCAAASRVVVMTGAAGQRLNSGYSVDAEKMVTIPHGAARPTAGLNGPRHGRVRLLTWGLLGPGKGIEHAIDAMALLSDLPHVTYTIAGVTHPKVFARDGDVYRRMLIARTEAHGVSSSVTFDDSYRNVPSLTRLITTASLVVLPYDSHDQVTSGVLVDAIAAGRPVIATAFPHAVELLASGAGTVVAHADPAALAAAVRDVATNAVRMSAMTTEAERIGSALSWSAIAAMYGDLCVSVARDEQPVAM